MRLARWNFGRLNQIAPLLIVILCLTAKGADGQQDSAPSIRAATVEITEGQIPQSSEDNELRLLLNLMVAKKGSVFFDYNSDSISAEAKDMLDQLVEYMNRHSVLTVDLEGRSGNHGKEKGNCALAIKRAERVKGYLADRGVSPSRMRAYGSCGQFQEEASQADSNAKLQRVDFFLN